MRLSGTSWALRTKERPPCIGSAVSHSADCYRIESAAHGTFRKTLSRDAERAVELARHILERDEAGQFHDGIIGEIGSKPFHQLIVNPQIGTRHGFSVFEKCFLSRVEQEALLPSLQSADFFDAYAALDQRGRIQIHTKGAGVDL